MKKHLSFVIALLMIVIAGETYAKSRRARLPKSMGLGNAGAWLQRGALFDFDRGAGIDLPGFGNPLDDDGDPFDGEGGGGEKFPGDIMKDGSGFEWAFGGPFDDSSRTEGGCGYEECYIPSWTGPCEYICECWVWWDPRPGSRDGIEPGTRLWGRCSLDKSLHGTAPGDCAREGQTCATTDW